MTQSFLHFTLALSLFAFAGCQPSAPPETTADSHGEHDHDHDGHDHDGHDHSHDGHDHDGHDHHGHDHETIDAAAAGLDADALVHLDSEPAPETFAEAVDRLTKMKTSIAKGFGDDDVDSIHGELHDIGNLLEQTESCVKKSDMAEEQKKQALAAIDTLFEAFGTVDAKLHGDEGADYSDVSGDIDDAMQILGDIQ
ncbi:hypothetical protein LOC71_21285 [Rhodopirellula sp. JC740]|uniref:Uncharacterized protein n=1 Tax=Rhodopirellula halodulae TaxID=2894198 RepID=A0ABS8NMK9_9BACT|nr:hypothetical protein [Rhodopirellula sp. JC740]MCC9644817.1 hypothetical protein [Rhodopirellula sp. JC740]